MADIDVNGSGGGGRGSSGRRRGRGGLRLVETIQPISTAGEEDVVKDAMPFVCLLSLGENVNVDLNNGSYSLDDVVVVNHPSPNDDNDNDDNNDNDGNGNGGRFSTLPLLPASTFIVIGSGGTPSSTRRIISTLLSSCEFTQSSSTIASADGNLMTNCCWAADVAHCCPQGGVRCQAGAVATTIRRRAANIIHCCRRGGWSSLCGRHCHNNGLGGRDDAYDSAIK